MGSIRQGSVASVTLESIKRRWTREIHGLGDMDYAQRLRTLDIYS